MIFAVKAVIVDPRATQFSLARQKTMYKGRAIAVGDTVFVFASENEGGPGLIAKGRVTQVKAIPLDPSLERQTPRVSVRIRRVKRARRTEALLRLEGWPSGDRTELQVLSPGHEQDRCDQRRCGEVPGRTFLRK